MASLHGTNSCYSTGCRLPACRVAHSEYQKKYYATHPVQRERKGDLERRRRQKPEVRVRYLEQSRRSARKQAYGISGDDFEKMLVTHNGGCWACGSPETSINSKSRELMSLSVDHNHVTGAVRGLLCRACNVALGQLGDSRGRILALLSYIDEYSDSAPLRG